MMYVDIATAAFCVDDCYYFRTWVKTDAYDALLITVKRQITSLALPADGRFGPIKASVSSYSHNASH